MATHGSSFDTDVVASTLLEKLNESSVRSLMTSVATAIGTQSEGDLTSIQNQINLINTKLNEVESEAKILSEDELAQVEQAIKEVLQNLEANGFLGLLCVEIGGTKLNLKDLVQRLATADRVKEVEKVWDANYETIQSIKLTLEDNSIITFTATIDDGADYRNYTFDADWKGIPAQFFMNFAKVERTINVGGESVTSTEYVLKKKSNVLFSLTDGLGACVETTIEDSIPDLNSDGTIGNVPPAPASLSLASTSGSVVEGENVTVGFSDAQGAVSAVSSDNGVATVSVNADSVTITGVSAGSANISVTDGATTVVYAVTVTAAAMPPMTVDKTALSIDVGSSDTITVSNADAPVTAVSSNPSLITTTVSGNVITVTAVGATDPDTVDVSISDGDDTIVVTVYSAVSGGGGL